MRKARYAPEVYYLAPAPGNRFSVKARGWYLVDDDRTDHVVAGPFASEGLASAALAGKAGAP